MVKPLLVERLVTCKSDRCALWSPVTNTERLNRVTGGERLAIRPNTDSSAARFITTTNLGGFSVEYEERPYEWVYLEQLRVFRVFRGGPITTLEFGFKFTPTADGGTIVRVHLEMTPRLSLMRPILQFRAAQTLGQMVREVERIDQSIVQGRTTALPPAPGTIHESALTRAATELRKLVAPEMVERLVGHIRSAPDYEIGRTRPYVLADEWGVERRDVLSACLHGVKTGMFELRWEVVCPSCRTASSTLPSLSELSEHGACQVCELAFAVDLDQAIEASFAPAAAVREVDAGPYCVGSPSRLPHVLAQSLVAPGGEGRLVAPESEENLRLFVRGGAIAAVVLDPRAPERLDLDIAKIDPQKTLYVRPHGTIHLHNQAAEERHAKLERLVFVQQAASARDVTALPVFRREFSSDLLRPGLSLKISSVSLLFTDLTGSTLLYATVGDAAAFKLVQDHFDVVVGVIEQCGGTLVKTMGDAVMAAFTHEEESVAASLQILEAFEAWRHQEVNRQRTHIKLGIYTGPCYVITANGVLDYFGQTVNIAARMQAQADSGELVVEQRVADHAVARGAIPARAIKERYLAKLKGVDGAVPSARIVRA